MTKKNIVMSIISFIEKKKKKVGTYSILGRIIKMKRIPNTGFEGTSKIKDYLYFQYIVNKPLKIRRGGKQYQISVKLNSSSISPADSTDLFCSLADIDH
jgi:hypothetical protein